MFSHASSLTMTGAERARTAIMVVEPEPNFRSTLKQSLGALGFPQVYDAPNFVTALKKLDDRKITHLIFDAKPNVMTPEEFLSKIFEWDEHVIAIPASAEPSVDDVFNLLILGARGFMVKPFTTDTIDDAITMATKGEPISDSILHAKNRNEALASLALSSLYRLTTVMRQAQQFETARRELPKAAMAFKRAVEIGRTFAQGGEERLLEALVEICVERGEGPATSLGRARKRRRKGRGRARAAAEQQAASGESSSRAS